MSRVCEIIAYPGCIFYVFHNFKPLFLYIFTYHIFSIIKNALCIYVQKALILTLLVRHLLLSDVLLRLFHALDPLRTTRIRALLSADADGSFVGGPRKANATCGVACFSLDYTIYPPLIGDTACSENSFNVPLVYFGGFGCHFAFLTFKISFISSGVRFSPFMPTISSLRFFTLI